MYGTYSKTARAQKSKHGLWFSVSDCTQHIECVLYMNVHKAGHRTCSTDECTRVNTPNMHTYQK